MSDEHFRCLHGKVLRLSTTPVELLVSHEGGGPGYVHEGLGRVSGSSVGEGVGGGAVEVS